MASNTVQEEYLAVVRHRKGGTSSTTPVSMAPTNKTEAQTKLKALQVAASKVKKHLRSMPKKDPLRFHPKTTPMEGKVKIINPANDECLEVSATKFTKIAVLHSKAASEWDLPLGSFRLLRWDPVINDDRLGDVNPFKSTFVVEPVRNHTDSNENDSNSSSSSEES
jgi:hypothetical protein